MSSDEKKKLVKFNINCIFEKGQFLLEEESYCIELYNEYLALEVSIRRDESLDLLLSNKNVGVNILSKSSLSSLIFDISKPMIEKI